MSKRKLLIRKQKLFLIASVVVFLIPVVASALFGYSLVSRFVVDAHFRNIEEHVVYENRIMEGYLASLMLTGSKTKEKHFHNRYMMDDKVTSYFEIKDFLSLNETQVEVIESLYFYNTATGQVHTIDGTVRENLFFSTVMGRDFSNGRSFDNITELTFIEGHNYLDKNPLVLYILPVEKDHENNTYISFLIGKLNYELLNNIFKSLDTDEQTKFILSYQSKPFYSTDENIHNRILSGDPVDLTGDSTWLTNEERLLDTQERGVLSIDVVVNETAVRRQTLGFVFLQSISLGAITLISLFGLIYILRKNFTPLRALLDKVKYSVDSQEIKDEYQLIDFVFDELVHDKGVLEETNNSLNREKLLYHLLRNNKGSYRPLFLQECEEAGINLSSEAFLCLVIYQIEASDLRYESELHTLTLNQESPVDIYSVRLTDAQSIWLFCGKDIAIDSIYESLKNITGEVFDTASIGIGSVVDQVSMINDSFNKAQTNAVYAHENELSTCTGLPSNNHQMKITYPRMDLEVLESAIGQSDYDKVAFAINSLKDVVEDSGDFFVASGIYMACLNIINETREFEEPEEALKQFSMKNVYENVPASVKEVENRLAMLSYIFSNNAAVVKQHHGKSYKRIENVINYIEANYMEPHFSVKYMSAYMETTPSNLSQYFKKCTGRNLSEYIDSLRIQYTKDRLDQEDVNIKDIVSELGYTNVSSFIKKFKKATGQTPGEYKRMKNERLEKQ